MSLWLWTKHPGELFQEAEDAAVSLASQVVTAAPALDEALSVRLAGITALTSTAYPGHLRQPLCPGLLLHRRRCLKVSSPPDRCQKCQSMISRRTSGPPVPHAVRLHQRDSPRDTAGALMARSNGHSPQIHSAMAAVLRCARGLVAAVRRRPACQEHEGGRRAQQQQAEAAAGGWAWQQGQATHALWRGLSTRTRYDCEMVVFS